MASPHDSPERAEAIRVAYEARLDDGLNQPLAHYCALAAHPPTRSTRAAGNADYSAAITDRTNAYAAAVEDLRTSRAPAATWERLAFETMRQYGLIGLEFDDNEKYGLPNWSYGATFYYYQQVQRIPR